MLRFLFAFLRLAHSLLHLLGLAKAFGYGQLAQLNLSISKPVGLLWGLASLLFLVSAVIYLLKREWWYVGVVAVLLSLALILLVWQDAQYGNFKGKISLEKWRIETREYREFRGIRVPSKLEVTWKLKTGAFTWLKLELTDLQFNITERYLLFTNIREQHRGILRE